MSGSSIVGPLGLEQIMGYSILNLIIQVDSGREFVFPGTPLRTGVKCIEPHAGAKKSILAAWTVS